MLVGIIFLLRLFTIQVLEEEYKLLASDNSIKKIHIYPDRGIIKDRNGKNLVVNVPVYDIMAIPAKVKVQDTLAFCELMEITPEYFREKMKEASTNPLKAFPFIKQLSREEFARIADRLVDYPGFEEVKRTVRNYPHQNLAHVLGYIGEISETALEEDTSEYYRLGDYVGISGIEAAYEKVLRGEKGLKQVWVDARQREQGAYKGGKLDRAPKAGKELIATIDLDLQSYGEELMQNKKGAIVALEPATGEVLAMVSAPSYDPNLLTGRKASSNYGRLLLDEHKPLFNRAIRAKYPPGSTFKTVQALIALQEQVIDKHTVFPCNRGLVKCHGHPTGNVKNSIQYSCNPYYYSVYRRIIYQNKLLDSLGTRPDGDGRVGFQMWRSYLSQFNLGRKTNIDLVSEKNGDVPDLALYDDRYGKGNWKFSNVYSLGIGQGEMGVTPLQLANVAATIANRGHYYTPHLVKKIGESDKIDAKFRQKHEINIDKQHFEPIIAGMRDAYLSGTVWYQAVFRDIEICGKTGTSQNPHGEDHSVFIAFAPRNNPKIAMAVYVENAGFGGSWAAPIAALMIERYLRKEKETQKKWLQQYVLNKSFMPIKELPETPQDSSKSETPKPEGIKPENTQPKSEEDVSQSES